MCIRDRHNAIHEEEKELYEYALHSAVLLILPLFLAGTIGFCFGSIRTGIIVVIPFMILRKFSGGYHAKKLSHCLMGSVMLLSLCILFATHVTHDWIVLVTAGTVSYTHLDVYKRQLTRCLQTKNGCSLF